MTSGLLEIAVIVCAAAILGILAKIIKQPIILAYLAAGLLIGYFGLFHITEREIYKIFSELGIMFLLFLVGLEINYSSLRLVGKVSLILGLTQIIFTFAGGLAISLWLNFDLITAIYISTALTFSSTVIVVKLLSDKKDLNSLYGKISVGFLLVQDAVAILLLIFLTGVEIDQDWAWGKIFLTVTKGIILFAAIVWLGRKILPWLFDKIAHSQELLFLVSLAWVFALTTLINKIGFSIEIAGFLAGVALANSSEHYQIASRIKSLRDFFIIIFFIILGSSISLANWNEIGWQPIAIFSLFVLIGNPLIVLIIMSLLGYKKRTSFLTSLTTAQISEFSLILAALGLKIGHINQTTVSLITSVGIVTIALSSYLIIYGDQIFKRLAKILSFFEKKVTFEAAWENTEFKKPIILIGCHRVGQSIAANLPKEKLLIIDFDPDIVRQLNHQGFRCLFGDLTDEEILDKIDFAEADLVISTSPHLDDNLGLLAWLQKLYRQPRTIIRAETEAEAEILYRKGADYVLLPHLTAGQYLGKTIAIDSKMNILENLKEKDLIMMRRNLFTK